MCDRLPPSARQRLEAFLAFDIQDSYEWARELVEAIEAVRAGQCDRWERLGNAYQLNVSDTAVQIIDLVDEDSAIETIDLDRFHDACRQWLLTLDPSPVPDLPTDDHCPG